MPSRLFTDPDILSLIQTFEASNPWTSKNESPPLIRNTSNTHLISTTHLISRLAQVLSETDRKTALPKSQLAETLEIDEASLGLALQASQRDVFWTLRGEVLPDALVRQITATLKELVETRVVDLSDYAQEHDLDVVVLKKLVKDDLLGWRHLPSNRLGELYCSVKASEKIQQILSRHISDAASRAAKVDISAIPEFEDYSVDVITAILEDGGDYSSQGSVQIEGDRVVFVPSGFAQAEEERLQEILNSRVSKVLDQVAQYGYCAIENDDVALQNAVTGGRAARDVDLLLGTNFDAKAAKGTTLKGKGYVVLRKAVEESLESLKTAIDEKAQAKWATGERKLDYAEILRDLSTDPARDQSQLENIILDSGRYTSDLEAHLRSKLLILDTADQDTYLQLLISRLLIPISLHASGLEIVQDEALRTRLSAYATSHLLTDLPSLTEDLKAQHLLTGSRERDFTKFRATATEAKDLSTLQTAATKLAKKAKWDAAQALSATQVRSVKAAILQRTAHAMRPSSTVRPSDVLQHALWIALGVAGEGLFISAGKDTSRMIALYEGVPDRDEAMAERLRGLRDKLKKGEEVEVEVRELREAVRGVVDGFGKER